MELQEQIEIVKGLLEATKELNGEYQEGWDENIENGERLLEHLQSELKNLRLGLVGGSLPTDEDDEPDRVIGYNRRNGGKWVTEDCDDHTPYWGVCGTCGKY